MFTKGELLQNKYCIENGKIIDTDTGEVISKKEIIKAYQAEIAMKVFDSQVELNEMEQELGLRLVQDKRGNDYSVMNVKEGYHFVKVFKTALREVIMTKRLSKTTKAAFLDFQSVTSFPTNSVVIDGGNPSQETLCEFLDLKKSKLYEVLKELELADVIKREKMNGQIVIYINPYIYCCGLVDYDTLQIFNNSSYNPINRK